MIDKLFPWQCGLLRASSEDHVTTSQLIETIDALVYDDVTGDVQMQVSLRNYSVYFYLSFVIIRSVMTLCCLTDAFQN